MVLCCVVHLTLQAVNSFIRLCGEMSLDLQKVKSLPVQKSLLLINNFVINTTNFLNAFAETCEKKISQVSSKATELEIMLAVLEAKLNSIPDLDVVSTPSTSASSPIFVFPGTRTSTISSTRRHCHCTSTIIISSCSTGSGGHTDSRNASKR